MKQRKISSWIRPVVTVTSDSNYVIGQTEDVSWKDDEDKQTNQSVCEVRRVKVVSNPKVVESWRSDIFVGKGIETNGEVPQVFEKNTDAKVTGSKARSVANDVIRNLEGEEPQVVIRNIVRDMMEIALVKGDVFGPIHNHFQAVDRQKGSIAFPKEFEMNLVEDVQPVNLLRKRRRWGQVLLQLGGQRWELDGGSKDP